MVHITWLNCHVLGCEPVVVMFIYDDERVLALLIYHIAKLSVWDGRQGEEMYLCRGTTSDLVDLVNWCP